MKTLLILFSSLVLAVASHAQGTINFDNIGVGAPIYCSIVNAGFGVLPGAQAGLYVQGAGSTFSLVPGSVTTFLGNTDPLAQYLSAITVAVPSVAPGAAGTFEVRVWAGGSATWEDAITSGSKSGRSNPFTITTGGAGQPPSLPADLVGLGSFDACFPEPSTSAFGILGASLLLFVRRK
jgi:hypothetical protein